MEVSDVRQYYIINVLFAGLSTVLIIIISERVFSANPRGVRWLLKWVLYTACGQCIWFTIEKTDQTLEIENLSNTRPPNLRRPLPSSPWIQSADCTAPHHWFLALGLWQWFSSAPEFLRLAASICFQNPKLEAKTPKSSYLWKVVVLSH